MRGNYLGWGVPTLAAAPTLDGVEVPILASREGVPTLVGDFDFIFSDNIIINKTYVLIVFFRKHFWVKFFFVGNLNNGI